MELNFVDKTEQTNCPYTSALIWNDFKIISAELGVPFTNKIEFIKYFDTQSTEEFRKNFYSLFRKKHNYLYNSFVPLSIATWIEKTPLCFYWWHCKKNNVFISIGGTNSIKTKEYSQKLIKLFKWVLKQLVVVVTDSINDNKTTVIRIILTPFQKKFPVIDKVFMPIHANSGVAVMNTVVNEIFIFREEEVEKVFIHELVHILIQSQVIQEEQDFLANLIPVSGSSGNPVEAPTEFIANILLLKWQNKEFNRQRDFSLLQAAKILRYIGYTEFPSSDQHFILNQTTSINAYFILRALLWFDYNASLKYFTNNWRYNPIDLVNKIYTPVISNPKFKNEMTDLIKKVKLIGNSESSLRFTIN